MWMIDGNYMRNICCMMIMIIVQCTKWNNPWMHLVVSYNKTINKNEQFKGIIDIENSFRHGINVKNELSGNTNPKYFHLKFEWLRFYDEIIIGNKTEFVYN